ncbi:hypothetical protein [Desulfococcus multivorans]|uniref:Uncharacterized protein n=1 Tax=Desulfococcus multivorans DSM 2059 TaxID=1121405 RepID=S7TXX1_DESML|nr:hypothetical protein [Desulfococcus multivorans]AOY56886.1 putative phage resistance protein [Desulfococcus multivorans]AQU99422.1 hypothetical protein B2D07_00540 [Desulfococcus multivorans]EPR41902.1 hypothetical protein dsmv_1901 [Desulfococcus multivorans DSM 2059]SJZ94224.1 hypothetical protein SAMN02745446_02178 [Desulfococcus multivorans DSM 2059]
MPLIKDLIPIPEQVNKGDFVLRLTEGVQHPEETLKHYVVTDQLIKCFDHALNFIRSALEGGTGKATQLHGSFGTGARQVIGREFHQSRRRPERDEQACKAPGI